MPDMSVMCDPTCFCLCLECEAQLISTEVLHPQLQRRQGQPKAHVSGDARRAQEEANHDAAAQEDDDEAEEVPEDDDMDTQGYTSGYVSEEEDSGWYYRDRSGITGYYAICLDELREDCRCPRCGGCSRVVRRER